MSSLKKLLTWLMVVGVIALYPWAAITWYGINSGGLVITIPWSIASAVPPLVYTLVVLLCLRRSSVKQRIAAISVLCALHALLGIITGAVHSFIRPIPFDEALAHAFLQVPPSPFLQIIWTPLALLPFRHLFVLQRRADPLHPISLLDKSYLRTGPVTPPLPTQLARDTAPAAIEQELAAMKIAQTIAVSSPPGDQDEKVEAWLASLAAPESAPVTDRGVPEFPPPNPILGEEPSLPIERWFEEEPVVGAEQAVSGQGLLTSTPTGEDLWDRGPVLAPGAEFGGQAPPERFSIGTDQVPATGQDHTDIRIPFERITDQLPAEAFLLPLDQLASNLHAPNQLLIPQHLILSQLPEGAVRVPWSVVAAQFPRQALAVSDEEMAQRIPDGGLLLPLDEVVRQLSPEVLNVPFRSVDVYGIEHFPAPFQPSSSHPAPAEVQAESVDLAQSADRPASLSPQQAREREARSVVEPSGSVEAEWSIPETIEYQVATHLETERLEPTMAEAAHLPQQIEEAQRISGLLAPLGSPTVDVEVVGGVTLFVVSSPRLVKEVLVAAAARLVPLLAGGGGLSSVEQATLRGSEGAMVLTSLAPSGAGTSVLVAGVRQRGSLALVEALSRRVAAESRANNPGLTAASEGVASQARFVAEFEGVPVPEQVKRLAGSLQAFGSVIPSVLRDATDGTLLYLFLTPGTTAPPLGRFACDLHRTMRMNGQPGGLVPFQSAVVWIGNQRVDVRSVAEGSGGNRILVVAGSGMGRPGLAHLQAQRAAARLGSS